MPLTRLSLLDRLRTPGNKDSWNEFAIEYSQIVDAYARPYCRSEHDQRDIVQNVWLALCRLMPRFEYKPDRGRFHRLLKRIVRNTAIDWFRRRGRATANSELVNQAATISSPPHADDDRQVILKRAIELTRARVSPMVWRCFEQHVLEQRLAHDVAEELQISPNAVYVNASRVTDRIRSLCLLLKGESHND